MNTISSLLKFIGSFEPLGSIKMYAGSTAPDKWLFCRGQAVSRTTYAKLFGVIGTTYGAGDGSTTFNLPDLRDRMPIGAGNLYSLNASGGNKDAIVPYHNHSVSAFNTGGMSANASHKHGIEIKRSNAEAAGYGLVYSSGAFNDRVFITSTTNGQNTMDASVAHTHQVGAHNTNYAGTSGNTTNANLPPYRGINFIIFAGK